MNLERKTNKFYSFWTIFIFCLFLIFYGHFLNQQKDNLLIGADVKINNLPVDISAVSYLVGEINSGKLLAKKNSDLHLFPASLSKLMAAVIVSENFSLDEEIVISPYAISVEGEEGGLVVNEKIKAGDLLKVLLISSSNDAAIAFEEALEKKNGNFVGLMNQKAREFKLFNSAFFDASGLDRKGNFTSIEDLFKLSQEIYKNYSYIGEITRKKEDIIYSVDKEIVHNLKNTNILVGEISNLWGGKTGSTPEAKDCLLTIYEFSFPDKNDKMVVAIIVLNSSDRFGDTVKLYDWVKEQLIMNKV
jgi:D-alanyl-D-alanine carboxypeptidase